MDLTGDSCLANPSLQHGCFTVDDDGDWIKVVHNKKRPIKLEDDEQKTATSGQETKATDEKWYPPNHTKNNNMYELLSDFEVDDCEEEESDEKPAAIKTTNNKNKKIKTENTSSDNDEKIDFMAACDEARMH